MSNNYKLICKYAGELPLTVGNYYAFTVENWSYKVLCDDGNARFFNSDLDVLPLHKHFDLVPVDATPDPIMVQPADYIDPKLLEAYNALDEKGKVIMQKTWPDVKWPEEVMYATYGEYMDYTTSRFGVQLVHGTQPLVFNFPHDKYTPEINGGEIRFRVKE
jgi:hypothetical protein